MFKVGDKVKVVSLNGGYTKQYMSVGYSGTITRMGHSFAELDHDYMVNVEDIQSVKDINNLSTLEAGDVVVTDGYERMILAVCGRAVLLSDYGDFDRAITWYSDKELAKHYKLKEDQTESIEIEGKKYTASEIKEALKKAGK